MKRIAFVRYEGVPPVTGVVVDFGDKDCVQTNREITTTASYYRGDFNREEEEDKEHHD